MRENFQATIEQKTGKLELPNSWRLIEGSLESVADDPESYLPESEETVVVFSYCAHHCYQPSLQQFLDNDAIRKAAKALFILDVTEEHGWTKPFYMWADCESPENFDNVTLEGAWSSDSRWQEPEDASWCRLRKLT